ncbi:hypothetical protein AX17_001834, partial [Amanita inopinata Kibby_2008]
MTPGTPTSNTTMSAAPAWRQFTFFDVIPVKDVHDLDSPPDIFKAALEISCVASSSAGVLVADIHGSIHLLNRTFESINSWVAHVGGRIIHMAERNGILVTLGEESGVRSALLKIWDLSAKDKSTTAPLLLRSVKLQQPSDKPYPVSTIALSQNLVHLAIGLGDGTVLLYRHLDQSLASSTSLTSLPKVRTVHESSPTEPITGLGFKESTEESPNVYLFIVTTNHVLAYQVSGRGSGGTAATVDEIGCGLGCGTMNWKARDMVVARDEAIYLCGTDGRGACYAYEGNKSSIHTHRHYLVIVSPPFIPSAQSTSATVRNYVARTTNASESDITKVTVFDLENKYVAYSGTFTQGVREVVSQWGHIYILTNDGNLLSLQEKPTAAKLDILYRKSLYLLALNLAKTQGLDEASIADIHRQYGDHLYTKGDYDGAMQQYLQTIGHLQASYVIRKFLDAQRIHNLVTYLQELHSLGLANSDHTTLLLNTYTKLKDLSRLDSFIKLESKRNANDSDELPFDLDTAIRVCRQAGYFEHASYLAKKYERHEDYLRIQIEDAGNYKDALQYLRMLGTEAAESNLARYGRALLDGLPDETSQLLIDLCTTTGPLPTETDEAPPSGTEKPAAPTPSYLSYLALGRSSAAAPTTTSETAVPSSPSMRTVRQETSTVRDPQPETNSRSSTPSLPAHGTPAPSATTSRLLTKPPPPVRRISPRLYFAHFVDHMEQFVIFLETVASRRWGQMIDEESVKVVPSPASSTNPGLALDEESDRMDQVAVWNTLLELYLTLPGPGEKPEKTWLQEAVLRKKAINVLQSDAIPYDPTHALILCSAHGYTDGLVLLWERLGMHEDILRYWMDKEREGSTPDASARVVSHLKKHGGSNPRLYTLALRFFTSSSELLARHQDDVKDVLEHIEQEGILPPLSVVQVLSRNGVASVGLMKEWLIRRINDARTQMQSDQELTRSYRAETATKLRQVKDLSNTEQAHVFHVTRCSACGGQLDLPSIHFMCDHSYHQRCLGEHDSECPNCVREHSMIREIRRNNERLAEQHDVFLTEVQENGFEAVSSAFGRGVLNMYLPPVSPSTTNDQRPSLMQSSSNNPSTRRGFLNKLFPGDKTKKSPAPNASSVTSPEQDNIDSSSKPTASEISQLTGDFAKLATKHEPLQPPSGIGYSHMKTVLQSIASVVDGASPAPGLGSAFQIGLQLVQKAEMAKNNKQMCFDVAQRAYELLKVVNDMSIQNDTSLQDVSSSLT